MTTIEPFTADLQVFYDGACPLCSRECAVYARRDRFHRIQWVDIARPNFRADDFGLDPTDVNEVMHARDASGQVYTQVGAFIQIWKRLPFSWHSVLTTPLRWFLKIPGMLALANVFYRAFARNRYRLTGRCADGTCRLPDS